ncbi:MAG: MltR family transcriptional regulator [Reyranella sp.]|nr:MltR family transcriptional regulator [Reyranella sp.]
MAKNTTMRNLKSLTRNDVIPFAEMDKHVQELAGRTDRVAAIVGGSMTEVNVEGVLRRYLRPLSKGEEDALFTGIGPLSTFSNKARIAYVMGLLSDEEYRNISYVREIRNVFAHGTRPLRFRTPEIAAACKLFVINGPRAAMKKWQHPRMKYLATVLEIGRKLASKGRPSAGITDVYTIRLSSVPKAEHILGGKWPVKIVLPLLHTESIARIQPLNSPLIPAVLHAQVMKDEAIELYRGIQKIAGDLGWQLPAPPKR